MINTRLANQQANTDAPKGMDQVWQVVDDGRDNNEMEFGGDDSPKP